MKINNILYILLLIIRLSVGDFHMDNEKKLIDILFKNYSNQVRPTNKVYGHYMMVLKQLVALDERASIITTSSNIIAYWNDTRLLWTPSDYDNVTEILVPGKKVWTPDFVITNSADADIFLKQNDLNYALIEYYGRVNIVYTSNGLRTRCELDYTKFPFDKQKCTISLSSWSHSEEKFDFDSHDSEVSLEFYHENLIWDLISVEKTSNRVRDRFSYYFSDYHMENVNFELLIHRRPLYFMINNIFPCLVLNLLTLLAYGLPTAPQFTISIQFWILSFILCNFVNFSFEINKKRHVNIFNIFGLFAENCWGNTSSSKLI
jgi:hypothetical protein